MIHSNSTPAAKPAKASKPKQPPTKMEGFIFSRVITRWHRLPKKDQDRIFQLVREVDGNAPVTDEEVDASMALLMAWYQDRPAPAAADCDEIRQMLALTSQLAEKTAALAAALTSGE